MRCWIYIFGGLLIMMGQHDRSEALFYYFRLEDQVPENHLLRLIDRHISFEFVREKLRESYSGTGRPSIDPEVLLRILLIGYLYGVTSERKLVEELRMHLAWRWFTGLGFDQEIPHHSTFSKNRHGRFQESKLFEELFEQIVRQCVEVGLVQGKHLSVDGSFVEANAAKESRIPRERLAEAAQVNQTVRQYVEELEQQNPTEEPVHEQDQVSTTDPDATYATKGGTPARMGYYDNYLIANHSCVIVGVYRSWAIPCAGTTVYAPRHRAEWLSKIGEPGVRARAERLYQQLDLLQPVRFEARRELLAESHKHSGVKLLRQIPSIGPIRSALLVAMLQTPHRFRTKRQLWAYSGFAVETHDSGEYRSVRGKLQRNRERMTVRGLKDNHNRELKNLFKSAAISASARPGPLRDFYVARVEKGMRPTMARLSLARKIAAISLTIWKKGGQFDPQQLQRQAA